MLYDQLIVNLRIDIANSVTKCYLLNMIDTFGMNMKQLLKTLSIVSLALPTLVFANTPQTTTVDKVQAAAGVATAQAQVVNESTVVVSPRTGIRYDLGNTAGRPIVLKTAAIAAVTPQTVNRIVATNPALSSSSQEKAKQLLLASN